MNAAKSSGTSFTHALAASLMISNASKHAASVSGRVDARWIRAWMDGAGCSGCGMTGQPDGLRDLAQVIVREMVTVATELPGQGCAG